MSNLQKYVHIDISYRYIPYHFKFWLIFLAIFERGGGVGGVITNKSKVKLVAFLLQKISKIVLIVQFYLKESLQYVLKMIVFYLISTHTFFLSISWSPCPLIFVGLWRSQVIFLKMIEWEGGGLQIGGVSHQTHQWPQPIRLVKKSGREGTL